MRSLPLLLLLFASAAAAAESARAPTVDTWLLEGHRELEHAWTGRTGAAERALAAFDTALAREPGHPPARAGRGLALLALALEAPVRQKLALARRGCAELDAAVAVAPHDAAVRLLRASSATKMPRLLERQAVAEEDFALLVQLARDPAADLEPSTRRGIFYHAAAFALKERRPGAIDLLERAASIPASHPNDDQVHSLLALARRLPTSPSHVENHPEEASPPRP